MPSRLMGERQRLTPIDGSPPDLFAPPAGCGYFARCPYAMRMCQGEHPDLIGVGSGHHSRCWLQHPDSSRAVPGLHVPHRAGTRT
jgi:oligopeptide transport system ATP-binding protein